MNKSWFFNNFLPGWMAEKASKSLKKSNNKVGDYEIVIHKEIKVEDKIEELTEVIKKQFDARKTVEDKAKTILGSVAVAVTAITFAINNQNLSFGKVAGNISLGILTISIFSFIMATIRAIQVLNITPFYPGIRQYRLEENKIEITPKDEGKERLEVLFQDKILNDNDIVRKSNYAFAGFVLLRNGIISFAVFFLVALINKNAENSKEKPKGIRLIVPVNIKKLSTLDSCIVIDTILTKISRMEEAIKKH